MGKPLTAAMLLACCVGAHAQNASGPAGARLPADAVIEREIRKIERDRKAPFDAAAAQGGAPAPFPNIATPSPAGIDPEAIARRYRERAEAHISEGLLVFASLSMPVESLRKAIADTSRAGGAVVLRGFKDGSLKATAEAVRALGVDSGAVQINPAAFTKYRVTSVPAVVLVRNDGADAVDAEGCALPDRYAKVSGDVGLAYALDAIRARSPQFRAMAARYARPLQEAHR
ncbi:MAG: type-F conjugative transfer system pilin assembly protein TrbC [Betaproteobacteria bacterium]